MLGDLGLVVLALLLVALNAFFVLAEFAIVKVRSTRMAHLAELGDIRAKAAGDILARLDAYLSATQIGITLASLGLGSIGQPAFADLFYRLFSWPNWLAQSAAVTLATVLAFALITFLHIFAGELAPRFTAISRPEACTLFVARPLLLYGRIMRVPMELFHGGARRLLRVLGMPLRSEAEVTYTEEEMRSILGASQERGGFSFHHLLLLENAFDFGSLTLKDVSVPLDRVTFLDATAPWPVNAAVIAEKRLSRYPLRDGPRGKILGFIHVKTILVDLLAGRTPEVTREVIKLPRASEDLLLEVAVRKLQKSGEHMGLVTNTRGEDIGMFTLEDIVEELIGDIRDEFEASPTISLHDLLQPERILLDPETTNRADLVAKMAAVACEGVPGVDPAVAAEAVHRREKAVPASVGEGVAVPHARVSGLAEPRAVFARLAEGIDWQAPDGRPVRLAILFLTPGDAASGTQARFLQRIAGIMQSDYLRAKLLDASTPEEVREVLRIGETSAVV